LLLVKALLRVIFGAKERVMKSPTLSFMGQPLLSSVLSLNLAINRSNQTLSHSCPDAPY